MISDLARFLSDLVISDLRKSFTSNTNCTIVHTTHLADSWIVPGTVDEEEAGEKAKLGNWKVCTVGSLKALVSGNANSNLGKTWDDEITTRIWGGGVSGQFVSINRLLVVEWGGNNYLTKCRPGASDQKSAILSGTHEQTGFFQVRVNMSSHF